MFVIILSIALNVAINSAQRAINGVHHVDSLRVMPGSSSPSAQDFLRQLAREAREAPAAHARQVASKDHQDALAAAQLEAEARRARPEADRLRSSLAFFSFFFTGANACAQAVRETTTWQLLDRERYL